MSVLGLGCDSEPCTLIAETSFVVTVVDAETNEAISSATVRYVIGGDGPHTAEAVSGGQHLGPSERPGRYDLTVEADGYATEMLAIRVDEDDCHVLTEEVTVELVPEM